MLERLKEYREKFEEEKLEIETANDEQYIAESVAKYEAELRETLAEKRAEIVAKKAAEIDTIDKLIALETERLEAEESAKREQDIHNFFQQNTPAETSSEVSNNNL